MKKTITSLLVATIIIFSTIPMHPGCATPSITLDSSRYLLSSTAHVTVNDPSSSGSISINVKSTSDPVGITLTLSETGAGTHTFTGTFTFTGLPSSGSTLQAKCSVVSSVSSCDKITATFGSVSTTAQMVSIQFGDTGSNLSPSAPVSYGTTSYDQGTVAHLRVLDPSASSSVSVSVESQNQQNTVSLTLPETAPGSGVFTGSFIFMATNNLFPATGTVTITQQSSLADQVRSSSDTTGILLSLTQTGSNTFTGKLAFNSFSSSTQGIIKASGGDFVQIQVGSTTTDTNGLVTPNSDLSKGALLIDISSTLGDTVVATYQGITTSSVSVGYLFGEGGGGGGVVAPSLVLDVTAAIGGGAPPPPAFSLHSFVVANGLPENIASAITNQDALTPIEPTNEPGVPFYPLTIDGNGYLLGGYANTIDTVKEQVGKPMTLALTTISSPVVHISLFTNLHSLYDTMQDSDTYIIYDKGEPLQIVDPHGFFSNVTITPVINGTKQSFVYGITFAKPMNTSNIMIRAWDDQKASTNLTIYDAWQATPHIEVSSQNTTQNDELSKNLLTQKIMPVPVAQNKTSTGLLDSIKEWGGYSPTSISDSQLLGEIGIDGKSIPPWFMKTTKWIVQGETTQQEFVNGIKYLYEKGLVH
ncbi:MAG: hypothetical protein KGI08_05300 [Thaumarchaeota archaeon]|nr:hypothetical protein [Nitrososphaerota archaeon]